MLPGDVLAGCAADGRHLRAAGVLHRNLLLRRLRRPPHQDQQVSQQNLSAESVSSETIRVRWNVGSCHANRRDHPHADVQDRIHATSLLASLHFPSRVDVTCGGSLSER